MSIDNTPLRPRWLHIGFGAFARAHTIAALDRSQKEGLSDWGVVVARLNSGAEELDALAQSGYEYHVAEVDDAGATVQTVEAVIGTCHPLRDGADALHSLIASPTLSLITLTITEKGYRDGHAMTALCDGLAQRKQSGNNGLTILSCDNLSENGALTRQSLLTVAAQTDASLATWIDRECRFPSSMVDRIVPAMTRESHAKLDALLGKSDPHGVICEPFFQWVIEDDFLGSKPPLDLAGVQWVDDIRPWEAMKLRMLNGSHTFLALLGRIAGHKTIDACMADAVFSDAVSRLMLLESAPTLPALPGADLPAYAQRLVERFRNAELKHRTEQIATDTSQKLPQRLLESIAVNMHDDRDWALSALAIGAWGVWLLGQDDNHEALPLSDPLESELTALVANSNEAEFIDNLLNLAPVFPVSLAQNAAFREQVKGAYATIRSLGARAAIAETLNQKAFL
ncbi:mannitol dehydrogenase family protein [Vreelandella sp. 21]|uniref:mannitol dehydrogenase family protein n=1 Tax=Vreelandella sp. 21 TaxID=3402864 RepID=UPI003D9AB3EC